MTEEKITAADVREDFPEEKRRNDRQSHLWAHLAIRPLSFYLTPVFVNRGIGANAVTGLGLVVLLAGLGAILATPVEAGLLIVGAVLVNLWYLLDFVDGNVARYTDSDSTFGAFFDWYVGTIYHTGLPLCVAIALYLSDAFVVLPVDTVWLLVVAVAWVVVRLLRRLTAQKVSLLSEGGSEEDERPSGGGNEDSAESESSGTTNTLEMLAGATTSFKSPTLLVFAVLGAVDVWLVLYAAYNLTATPVQLLLNVRRLRG